MFKTQFEVGPLLPRIRASFSRPGTRVKSASHSNEQYIGAIYTCDTPKERANHLLSADVI
jgi:hypothetical protein